MTMLNLLKHELQSRLGAIAGWSISLALFGLIYLSIYPEMRDQLFSLGDTSLWKAMKFEVGTFEGFVASVVVQLIPVYLGIYVIITSTDTLAGEEDRGILELLLSLPFPRWQIVTVKATAISVASFIILVFAGLGSAVALQTVKATVETIVTPGSLFLIILSGWPITLAFIMIGLFLGAFLPNRRSAAAIMTFFFITSYLAETLTNYVPSLGALRYLSLFYYFDSSAKVFTEGVKAGDVLTLLGLAAFFFVLAVLSFQRRNVTVEAWPWQRAKISR
jgi:ABC-2 type transport system permease protein